MKIFKLKKDISSPQFTRKLDAGRLFRESFVKQYWEWLFWTKDNKVLDEWFEDVSDRFTICKFTCRIIPKKNEVKVL